MTAPQVTLPVDAPAPPTPTVRRRRWHVVAAVIAIGGLITVVLVQLYAQRLGGVGPGRYRLLTAILLWQALAIVIATLLRWIRPRRLAAGLIVASVIALPLASLTRPAQISDDLYRYAWDGRLQAAGVEPYRYPPNAPELARFRDNWLWPDAATCVRIHKRVSPPDVAIDAPHACTRINRPAVRTIYPPAAESYFLLTHWLPGPKHDHRLQLDAALLSAGLTALLAFGLRRTGRDPLSVAYYSLSPLAGLDIAGDAHVDVLATLFGVGALLVATLRPKATGRSGLLAGLSIAVKLYPALLLPALLRRPGGRRGAMRLVAAAAGVVILGYLPHVLAVGPHVLGYLPGYLHEENYDSGVRFLLIGLLGLGATTTKALAVLILVTVIAVVAVKSWRERITPSGGALALLLAAFLVATPSQPWYALLLVCVTVLTGRLEWIAVTGAPYALYVTALIHENPLVAGRLAYAGAAVIGLLFTLIRRRRNRQMEEKPQHDRNPTGRIPRRP